MKPFKPFGSYVKKLYTSQDAVVYCSHMWLSVQGRAHTMCTMHRQTLRNQKKSYIGQYYVTYLILFITQIPRLPRTLTYPIYRHLFTRL